MKCYDKEKKTKNNQLKAQLSFIRELILSKNFGKAFNMLEDLKDEYQSNPYYIFEYGVFYYESKNYEKAIDYFESLLLSINKYHALYFIGKINSRTKKFDEAEQNFLQIINSNSNNKEYGLLELCKVYKYSNRYEEALNILSELAKIDNERIKCAVEIEKAEIMFGLEKYQECETIINNVIKKIKHKKLLDKALVVLADNAYEQGNVVDCEKYLRRIKENSERVNLLWGKIEYERNNFLNCKKICDDLLQNDEVKIDATILYGKLLLKVGNLEQAEKVFYELINKEKNRKHLNFYLGIINLRKMNLDLSIDNFDFCIENNCRNADDARLIEIYIYIKQNNINKAYELFLDLKNKNFFKERYYDIGYTLTLYFDKMFNKKNSLPLKIYIHKQIFYYDEKLALEHILEHKEEKEGKHSVFSENIDVVELIKYVKENLNNGTFLFNHFFDEYLIRYDGVGYENGILKNYIKVVTLPNSDKIITLYPSPKFSLNYNETDDVKEKIGCSECAKKTKRLSQIEKFNKRYNRQ